MSRRHSVIAIAALGLGLMTSLPAAAQTCDPAGFSGDPADFSHLAVEDFQGISTTFKTYLPADNYVLSDALFYGYFGTSTGWCIPGMDNGGTCGGTNVYLATSIDLTIEPLLPVTEIGFRYGTQGSTFTVDVQRSDGSSVSFGLTDQESNSSGASGYFGYATCDPALTIVSVAMSGADGGIDDFSVGNPVPVCDDLDGDGFTTCDADCDDDDAAVYPGALEICDGVDNSCDGNIDTDGSGADVCDLGCDIDSLRAKILSYGLPKGIENALLAKVDSAEGHVDDGKVAVAINNLHALEHQVEAQSGKKVDQADADELLECLAAILSELAE